jgi:hypothetical protein
MLHDKKRGRTLGKAALIMGGLLLCSTAFADAASDARARCAVRLAITLTGQSPSAALLQSATPQSQVDALLDSPEFLERFSRFINASFNDEAGALASEDASYWLTREIVSKKLPWKDLFLGAYKVDVAAGQQPNSNTIAVTADTTGLGYFRSRPWQLRYAGNELAGAKLVTAYRIMQNVIGIKLTATTNAPGADLSATGRMNAACSSCHYDSVFALDKVASILTTRTGTGNNVTFTAPKATSAVVLGGRTITDDKSLVQTLVDSDSFKFNACRLAFKFLYGRDENKCEGPLFDQCIDAFTAGGTIQSAVATIAKDASFCQ